MSVTTWRFVMCPDGAVVRYPRTRFERFYGGREPVGHGLTGVARFLDVALELEDRAPIRVLRVDYPRFALTHDGRISRQHGERALIDAANDVGAPPWLPVDRQGITSIEPHLARRRMREEHRWQPTPAELDRARDAINEAAGSRLVVHDGQRLLSVAGEPSPPFPPLRLI